MTIAVYPGSFDPITLGHVDIVTRASQLFDKVVMAVVRNPQKDPLLSIEERVDLLQRCLRHLPNVVIDSFEGMTVDFARQQQAEVILRGLRAVSDFEFEFRMAQMNKTLCPEIETVFLMAGLEYQFLTSSVVKEVALLGGDVSGLVPAEIWNYFQAHHPPACRLPGDPPPTGRAHHAGD
jgi:pantetheine-phosphate adenylyltransferase